MQPALIAKTERTRIRQIDLSDAAFIVNLMNTQQWIENIGDRELYSLADAKNFIEKYFLADYQNKQYGYYVAENFRGEAIGIAGFKKRAELKNIDLGFALMPAFYNQGYAYEMSLAVLDYGVENLGFNTLDAITLESNRPSQKLLEKLGFQGHGLINFGEPAEQLLLYRWVQQGANK